MGPSPEQASPVALPTHSAWSRSEPMHENTPGDSSPAPRETFLSNLPLAAIILFAVVMVGFAVIVAWLIVQQGTRNDRQAQALDNKLEKLDLKVEKWAQEFALVKNEQARRQGDIQRVPGLADKLNDMQEKLGEVRYTAKANETQVLTNTQELAQLRRELTLVRKDVNDLLYARKLKPSSEEEKIP